MQNTEIIHINTLVLTINFETRTTFPGLNKGKGNHSRLYKTIKNISKYLQ